MGSRTRELAPAGDERGAEVAGTPQCMAPEQARGLREEIDSRSDQFSLAAIAYVLLTGREPFEAEDFIAVLYQVVTPIRRRRRRWSRGWARPSTRSS